MAQKTLTAVLPAPVKVGTNFTEQKYLFAFAARPEVVEHLRTRAIRDEHRRTGDILEAWDAAQTVVQRLGQTEAGIARTIQVEDIPLKHHARVQEIISNNLFLKTFQLPITVGMVDVDKLVAPQRTVDLNFVRKVQAETPANPTVANLIELCLAPRESKPPVQHLEVGPGAHVFSSPSTDLRFLGGFLKELTEDDVKLAQWGGTPVIAIISFVGYGADAVNAFASEGRVVLNNGFNRVYALRELGIPKLPMVIQQAHNFQIEFPTQIVGVPREYLLGHPRPVILKDFFDDRLTTTLKVPTKMKVVAAQLQQQSYEVPA